MRKAFSMIELVFAIVVVGVASTVLPTIISSSSQNDIDSLIYGQLIYGASQQAYILADSSWDSDDIAILRTYPSEFGASCAASGSGDRCRLANRRGILPTTVEPTAKADFITPTSRTLPLSVNDYDGYTQVVNKVVGENDLVNMNIGVTVDYVSDVPISHNFNSANIGVNFSDVATNNITNLKLYTITATNLENNGPNPEQVVLRMYGANVGANTRTVAKVKFK